MTQTIDTEFQSYLQAAYGNKWDKLPLEQRSQCRAAFFGGVTAALASLSESKDQIETVRQLLHEIRAYQREIAATGGNN